MKLPPSGDQEEFYEALLRACTVEPERSVIMLLWRTGMHASTLCGGDFRTISATNEAYIEWERPKTGKSMRAVLPYAEYRTIRRCKLAGLLPNTTRTLGRWVQRIGDRAGYPGTCPLTLRHSRAVWLLDNKMPINRVASLLGCSWQVLEKHYAQIEAARLIE